MLRISIIYVTCGIRRSIKIKLYLITKCGFKLESKMIDSNTKFKLTSTICNQNVIRMSVYGKVIK